MPTSKAAHMSCHRSTIAVLVLCVALTACGSGGGGGSTPAPATGGGGGSGGGTPPASTIVTIGGVQFDTTTSAHGERTVIGAFRTGSFTFRNNLSFDNPGLGMSTTYAAICALTTVQVGTVALPCLWASMRRGNAGNCYAVDVDGHLREVGAGTRNATTGVITTTTWTTVTSIWLPANATEGMAVPGSGGNAVMHINRMAPGGHTGCAQYLWTSPPSQATYDRLERWIKPGSGLLLVEEYRFNTAPTPTAPNPAATVSNIIYLGPGSTIVTIGGIAFNTMNSAMLERTPIGAARTGPVTYRDNMPSSTPTFTDTYDTTAVLVGAVALPCLFVDLDVASGEGRCFAVDVYNNLRVISTGTRNLSTGAVTTSPIPSDLAATTSTDLWLSAHAVDGQVNNLGFGKTLTTRLNQTAPDGTTGCTLRTQVTPAPSYQRRDQWILPGQGLLLREARAFSSTAAGAAPWLNYVYVPTGG